MAVLFSWIESESKFFKAEGGLRKKIIDEGKKLFPSLNLEIAAVVLEKLKLFSIKDEAFVPDKKRIGDFSMLSPAERQEYWAAAHYIKLEEEKTGKPAAWENFGFSLLREKTSIIHGFLELLDPQRLYPKITLRRYACLFLREESGKDPWGRRLFGESPSIIFELFLEALEQCGILSSGDGYYRYISPHETGSRKDENKAVIAMDSAFGFVLYPDISFADALLLTSFCSIKDNGSLELLRASAIRGFDSGFTAEKIILLLKRLSGGKIDSNLELTLKDWEARYTSVSLYSGEVLTLSEDKRYLTEIPPLSSLIRKTLAPGVYLLNTNERNEIKRSLVKTGIDIFSQPASTRHEEARTEISSRRDIYHHSMFPSLEKNRNAAFPFSEKQEAPARVSKSKSSGEAPVLKKRFSDCLKKLDLSEMERDELLARIERRLILTESQLSASTIKFEKLEARGLDYSGKTILARSAVSASSILEATWQDQQGKTNTILGVPSALEKAENELILVMRNGNAEDGELRLPLRKISRLRKIKQSIFEE